MSLYSIGKSLQLIKEKNFKLERDIQRLIEANLPQLLKLDFIRSEFSIGHFRIDTLAFDKERNSFVIIEYKRDKSFSVIDQGYAYLSTMLNNKADFILEYNETMASTLKRNDVDWSQSRVIFISPRFSAYQKDAINFKDLPIELFEIRRYSNETILFEQVHNPNSTESINVISKSDKTFNTVNKEVKVYNEQDHLNNSNEDIQELYLQIRDRIQSSYDNIMIQPKKQTVGLKINENIFCDFVFQKKELKLFLNLKSGDLDDSKGWARDVSNVGHWGNGSYEIKISSIDQIEYILYLLSQSIEKNKD